MIIAVDAAGGEYAPHEIVKGAIKAAEEYEVDIALVGNKTMLHVLCSRYRNKLDIDIKRAGRFDRKIPFLYNQTNDGVESVLMAQFRKHAIPAILCRFFSRNHLPK